MLNVQIEVKHLSACRCTCMCVCSTTHLHLALHFISSKCIAIRMGKNYRIKNQLLTKKKKKKKTCQRGYLEPGREKQCKLCARQGQSAKSLERKSPASRSIHIRPRSLGRVIHERFLSSSAVKSFFRCLTSGTVSSVSEGTPQSIGRTC